MWFFKDSLTRKSVKAISAALLVVSSLTACGQVAGTAAPDISPSALLDSAIAAQNAGDSATAKSQLEQIVNEVDPLEEPELVTTAYFNLGVLAQKANDLNGAIANYRRALVIAPDYKPAIFNLALAITPIDAASAQMYYSMLVSISPEDANALYNFGLLKYQMGDKDGGRKLLKRAFAVAPELEAQLPDDVNL